jgi:acetyl esterase/lipase
LELFNAPNTNPYFRDVVVSDPLVFPARSEEVLARFPPSLLIASSRDQALSSVIHTHSRLVALGVDAELHVWEGLGHAFFFVPDLAESREVYDVTVRFFDRHLGKVRPARAGRTEERGSAGISSR